DENFLQPGCTFKLYSSRELARDVDRVPGVLIAPLTHAVVVLQGKPDRIHTRMAGLTDRVRTVLLHGFAHGQEPAVRGVRLQVRNPRRRRWRGTQQGRPDPPSPLSQ